MCCQDPILSMGSLAFALINACFLGKGREVGRSILTMLPLLLFMTLFNTLTNHRGLTVLFTLFGQPFTLEALINGFSSGCMVLATVAWFGIYGHLMTSDRFLCLFGRILPSGALMISMTLRLLPETLRRGKALGDAHKGMPRDPELSSRQKRSGALRRLTALMSWAMEDSLQTADSMNARGHGRGKRTHLILHPFRLRDGIALGLLVLAGGAALWGMLGWPAAFYPRYAGAAVPWPLLVAQALVYCFPLLAEGREVLLWMQHR